MNSHIAPLQVKNLFVSYNVYLIHVFLSLCLISYEMKGQVSLVVLVPWEIMKGFSLSDKTQFLVGLETTRVTEAAITLLKVVG